MKDDLRKRFEIFDKKIILSYIFSITREKTDLVFDALGATDELSASLGVAREYAYDRQMENVIAIGSLS